MRIAVDIDDTLNIVDRLGRAQAYITRKQLPFRIADERSNWFAKVFDWTDEDVLQFMREGGISAFTEAEARPGAREALTRWRADGNEIVILTSRHKEWFGNPVSLSRDWMEKRKLPYDEIVAEIWDKGKYCAEHGISILVDDNPEILRAAHRLGVKAVCALGRHNPECIHEFEFCGENWKQIDAIVHAIYTQS